VREDPKGARVQACKNAGMKECKSVGEAQGSKSAKLSECRNQGMQECGRSPGEQELN
jgi:hypothetical protein